MNPVKDDSTCGGEKFAAVLGDWNAATWTGMEQFGVTKGKLRNINIFPRFFVISKKKIGKISAVKKSIL